MAMNLSRALCGRNVFAQMSAIRHSKQFDGIRYVTMKVVPKKPDPVESHDERNMRMKREMSPHLTIYQYQLTTILSITHRFTGLALTGYATAFGLGAIVLPHDFSHYLTMLEGLELSSASLVLLKVVLAYPAAYHLCNGVRHLIWDNGKMLKIKEVYSTGYAMLGASAALTVLLALL